MNIRSVGTLVSLFALIVSASATPALGQAPSEDENRWGFVVAPYLMFPHMNGQASVAGNPVEVDVTPGDIFENLDFGAMLYLEMANRDWAITLDGLYMNLGAKGQTPVTGRDAQTVKHCSDDIMSRRLSGPDDFESESTYRLECTGATYIASFEGGWMTLTMESEEAST